MLGLSSCYDRNPAQHSWSELTSQISTIRSMIQAVIQVATRQKPQIDGVKIWGGQARIARGSGAGGSPLLCLGANRRRHTLDQHLAEFGIVYLGAFPHRFVQRTLRQFRDAPGKRV